MTEQEKREKRIEKMARDMCNRKMTCEECIGVHGDIYFRDKSDCKYCFAATRAYNAGYRKADEVKKETAKRFLKMLYDMGVDRQTIETCGIYDVNGSALARFVSQEFGVEVEE